MLRQGQKVQLSNKLVTHCNDGTSTKSPLAGKITTITAGPVYTNFNGKKVEVYNVACAKHEVVRRAIFLIDDTGSNQSFSDMMKEIKHEKA